MTLHDDAAYRAIETHDARFDGRLFVGVTTTGVYCRPVCRVRTPRRENCRFFAHAALAEAGGFRPCLRCRPELAPGLALIDSPDALAQHAAQLLEQAVQDGADPAMTVVASRLGVTDRHLRRVFMDTHGVTPLGYLTTQRLLLAKRLLTDTALPVTEVAMACGFASLRRFHAAFAERYRLAPGALRRQRDAEGDAGAAGTATPAAASLTRLRLAYRPPYDLAGVMRFLARRAVPGLELVQAGQWQRSLSVDHQGRRLDGWFSVRFDTTRHEVQLDLSPALTAASGAMCARLRQALDLDADPSMIEPALAHVPAPHRPGLRVPGAIDGFEAAVRVILGQQVTVQAAQTLTQRLVERFGATLDDAPPGLGRLFPDAHTLASASAESIGTLGIVRQRVGALQAVARAVTDGSLSLHRGAPLQATLDRLQALPGIGPWTVQLIAMRALAWPDAWPASDIGLLQALGTRDVRAAQAQAEAWRPWRAYAVLQLWHSLESP